MKHRFGEKSYSAVYSTRSSDGGKTRYILAKLRNKPG